MNSVALCLFPMVSSVQSVLMTLVLFNAREYYQPSYHVYCIISPVFMASVLLNTREYYKPNSHVDGIISPISIHGLGVI